MLQGDYQEEGDLLLFSAFLSLVWKHLSSSSSRGSFTSKNCDPRPALNMDLVDLSATGMRRGSPVLVFHLDLHQMRLFFK